MSSTSQGPVTLTLLIITGIAAVIGGVVVITNPQTLTFSEYLSDLAKLATGLGLLGVGRGIHHASKVAHRTQPVSVTGVTGTVSLPVRTATPQFADDDQTEPGSELDPELVSKITKPNGGPQDGDDGIHAGGQS